MDTPGSPLHQLRTLNPRDTDLGGSACHGDDARPPARRDCRASPRGRRGRRRRGRRPGTPRRARRPGTLWSRQRPQPLHQRLGALREHPFPAHAFETFAAARATALVEQIRSNKLVRDIRDLLAADQLETATYDLLARAAERAGDPDTAGRDPARPAPPPRHRLIEQLPRRLRSIRKGAAQNSTRGAES